MNANANANPAQPATILVVDDAPINIGVVVDSLEDEGFRVLIALDGEEALERAHFSQPDLILLDVKMPGIDGFETCRRLKREEQTREIPVIFMTSLGEPDDLVAGFSAGGIDYVTKPFQIAEMLARIRTHLALRALHKQLRTQNVRLSNEVAAHREEQAALSRVRDELEIRVAERTSQLARANANLLIEIDERKRTETKLVSSETRFRTIVETSPVPLCITSMHDGRVLYMNAPFRWLFALDKAWRGVTYIADFYVDPTERDRTIALMRAEGGFTNAEIQFKDSTGASFWAVATARIATFDDAPAIYVGFNDVTARKQAEEMLRASEASLANAQRLAKLGDWEWNVSDGTTHWSYEMYRILGLEPNGVRPNLRTLRAALYPDDRAAVRHAVHAVIAGREPQFLDCRLSGSGGEPRIVQLHVECSSGGPGQPLTLVGTIQDITERKRVEQELLESRERLRELSAYMEAVREEERKRIAMEIHDELGQLLTALKMDVSLLRMRLVSDSEAARKTDDMRELVEKTIWMVRNVASHLRPAALNFGVVSALEWLVEDFVRRNQLPCKLAIHGGEPVLPDAHATAVFRIVQASLTNIARHARASRVDVTLSGDDDALTLQISDDGCGFDLAAARRRYSYGLLGMSERARLIGATLQIESAPGAGTTVSIHIPLTNRNHP
ncbi:Signal transduction histidine-protein kinase/phosphatase DegS [Burkholderia sp. AD24]|nr:Signal transduction histidine-protein kinase/phosphatase DegS [Burkholderia sp. AD24]